MGNSRGYQVSVVGHGCRAGNRARLLPHVYRTLRKTGGYQSVGTIREDVSQYLQSSLFSHFLSERLRLSDIPYTALDRSFVDKFDLHLRTECRLAPRTIILNRSRLHTVINKALAAGIITADPFAGYEPPRPERKQRYLTREGLKRLMTIAPFIAALSCPRLVFVLQLYEDQLRRYVRLTTANLETAEDGTVWIKAVREKTGVEFEIPLLDLPLHVIDKYRNVMPNRKLLPMYGNSMLQCKHLS